jgi:hypothetical protein
MKNQKKKRPFMLYLLMALILFQAISAIGGGLCLVISPSGSLFQMPVQNLKNTPFRDFLIPGIILLVFLGIIPAILFYALIWHPEWNFPDKLNIYNNRYWIWSYCLYISIMLIIWILVEILLIGYDPLQTIYGLLGVSILIVTLLPSIMTHYESNSKNNK